MDYNGYDEVASVYDSYASTDYDHDFFLSRVHPGMHVLELTSGTGRLSIPLAKAGATLTCVDISQAMLDVLKRKLEAQRLDCSVLCSDVAHLNFFEEFDLAIVPFQSFMEIVGSEKQRNTLKSVRRALNANGRFYCTMHNPTLRRLSVDGVLRAVGTFDNDQGTLVVSGFELGGDPLVRRSQFIDQFDREGRFGTRLLQQIEFELIDRDKFSAMAEEVGFEVSALFGDYDGRPFDSASSRVMIWELEKRPV